MSLRRGPDPLVDSYGGQPTRYIDEDGVVYERDAEGGLSVCIPALIPGKLGPEPSRGVRAGEVMRMCLLCGSKEPEDGIDERNWLGGYCRSCGIEREREAELSDWRWRAGLLIAVCGCGLLALALAVIDRIGQ